MKGQKNINQVKFFYMKRIILFLILLPAALNCLAREAWYEVKNAYYTKGTTPSKTVKECLNATFVKVDLDDFLGTGVSVSVYSDEEFIFSVGQLEYLDYDRPFYRYANNRVKTVALWGVLAIGTNQYTVFSQAKLSQLLEGTVSGTVQIQMAWRSETGDDVERVWYDIQKAPEPIVKYNGKYYRKSVADRLERQKKAEEERLAREAKLKKEREERARIAREKERIAREKEAARVRAQKKADELKKITAYLQQDIVESLPTGEFYKVDFLGFKAVSEKDDEAINKKYQKILKKSKFKDSYSIEYIYDLPNGRVDVIVHGGFTDKEKTKIKALLQKLKRTGGYLRVVDKETNTMERQFQPKRRIIKNFTNN